MTVSLDSVFIPSDEVVARDIEGEIIIVPLSAGIGDLEEEFFSLNDTGREIWLSMDGLRSLAEIAAQLALAFDAPEEQIRQDVLGLVGELLKRKMLVEVG